MCVFFTGSFLSHGGDCNNRELTVHPRCNQLDTEKKDLTKPNIKTCKKINLNIENLNYSDIQVMRKHSIRLGLFYLPSNTDFPLQSTPDNSNLQGKQKKVRVIEGKIM